MKELVNNANSKGNLIDFYGVSSSQFQFLTRAPDFSPKTALNIIKNDPTVKGSITKLTDKVLKTGWSIRGVDSRSRIKELEQKLKEIRFNRTLRQIVSNLILYNNVFIEIIKKGNEISDINVLETTFMRIEAKDNGDIVGYYQDIGRGPADGPRWTPEQVVHITIDGITSGVWSDLSIQSMYDTILLKDYIRQWLAWFFKTNQMRPVFNIKSASDVKVKDFMSHLKMSEKNVSLPLVFSGEATVEMLNTFGDSGKSIMDVLYWCDEQLLEVLQVPPIALGQPDASGRSNSVEQGSALNDRVSAIHKTLEEAFSYDLFPKSGFEKAEFEFGIVDSNLVGDVLDNVQKMRNAMFTEEAIQEYLVDQGMIFKTKEVLRTLEEMEEMKMEGQKELMEAKTGQEGMFGKKSADAAPSRQRQSNNDISKANKKTVVANAEIKFGTYPYTFEPEQ